MGTEDLIKLREIQERTDKLFDEWGYRYEMNVFKCLFEDSIFIPLSKYCEEGDEFTVDAKKMRFHSHLYEKGVKTLLMFHQGEEVYYEFLHELEKDGLIGLEEGLVYIHKKHLKTKSFKKKKDAEQ